MLPLLKVVSALTLLFVCVNSLDSGDGSVDTVFPGEMKLSLTTTERAAEIVSGQPTTIKPAKTNWKGEWKEVLKNSGVSAMHMILMPKTKKVLIYDATVWRISNISLPKEKHPCPPIKEKPGTFDCWSHAVFFDMETYKLQPLKITTDTWCSSGGLSEDGSHFVGTGGYREGARTVRYLWSCDECDWNEEPQGLAEPRWYSTQATLADGRMIVVGGRDVYSYEYIPEKGKKNAKAINFPFLFETKDMMSNKTGAVMPQQVNFRLENNLYPFVVLSPDGNVWMLANNRSILLDPKTDKIVHEFPKIKGGPRNYPASAMHALLPIKLGKTNPAVVDAEILVCGGSTYDGYFWADNHYTNLPSALKDCGRLTITKRDSDWKMEEMPSPRVMGDTVILPDGQVLMMNGAKQGTSGWHCAEQPNDVPILYNPDAPAGQRFKELQKSFIPRMYHSTAIYLQDNSVLVAGGNTNDGYVFKVRYSTELRVEKFYPPYMDNTLANFQPWVDWDTSQNSTTYTGKFCLKFKMKETNLNKEEFQVSLFSPSFTTHGIAMNQRLIFLTIHEITYNVKPGVHNMEINGPQQPALAPAGYYLVTMLYKGVPSYSMWLQVKK